MQIKPGADGGGEPAGERPGKRDLRALCLGDAERLPLYVSSEAGEEDGHLGREAAALDIDVVAHLVNEDGGREADAELPSVERPVDTDEGEEAEEELQLEDGEEESLAFEDDEQKRAERTE